ncbi:hypothetical protein C0989_004299 [Termitomyces sp. Mn162]|nr:hypothetical protein C0989_004299 [Termitomyces sp. Mn162]
MTSIHTPPAALSYRPCERKPSYTAPTKAPSPLRHATSYSRSSSRSSSDGSNSASSSFARTHSKTKSDLPSLRFDLASNVTATKMKRIHLLPILKRADKTLIQSNLQSSIQISIHTSESGTTTSLSSSSESSGRSLSEEIKSRSTPSPILLRPRSSKPVASRTMTSSKPKKPKASKGRATVNPRASIPERQRQRHVSFLPPGTNPGPKNPRELHSLLAYSPVRKFARFLDLPSPSPALSLAYDVSSPPCPYSLTITRSRPCKGPSESSTCSKMTLGPRMITATLSEPATIPPTTSQLVLTSPKFPWEVIATSARNNSASTSSPNASSVSIAMVRHTTNLDVLRAIHLTLATPVLPEEWALLSGSQKKRILKAYERRCINADGGWDEGVRRVDFLCGKTLLVGIDFVRGKEKDGVEPSVKGKMIFAHPPSASLL